MSTVTTVIFTCGILDDDKLDRVNEYFTKDEFPQQGLVDVTREAGGGKACQANVWLGAFNHFDEDAFFKSLIGSRWVHPFAVRVFLNREHDDGFETVKMIDGQELGLVFPEVKP